MVVICFWVEVEENRLFEENIDFGYGYFFDLLLVRFILVICVCLL